MESHVVIRRDKHPCGFPSCQKAVPSSKLACIEHWFSLPDNVRESLWRLFREAEIAREVRMTHRYLSIKNVALAHWVFQANRSDAVRESEQAIERAKFHRRRALVKGELDPFECLGLEDFFDDAEAFEEML